MLDLFVNQGIAATSGIGGSYTYGPEGGSNHRNQQYEWSSSNLRNVTLRVSSAKLSEVPKFAQWMHVKD
jgi:hypothetical protein